MDDDKRLGEDRNRTPDWHAGGEEILTEGWPGASRNPDPWSEPSHYPNEMASQRSYGGGLNYPFAGHCPVPEHESAARPYTNRFATSSQPYPQQDPRGYMPGGFHVNHGAQQMALVPYQEHQLSLPMRRYLGHLREEANSWILIGIVGFFLGFGIISGPLTWKKGSDLREAYRRNQLEPSPEANVAYYTGILSTMLVGVSVAFLILMFGLIGI